MLAPGHLLQLAYFGFEVLDVAEKERIWRLFCWVLSSIFFAPDVALDEKNIDTPQLNPQKSPHVPRWPHHSDVPSSPWQMFFNNLHMSNRNPRVSPVGCELSQMRNALLNAYICFYVSTLPYKQSRLAGSFTKRVIGVKQKMSQHRYWGETFLDWNSV